MQDPQLPATLRFMLAASRCEKQGLDALSRTCTLVTLLSNLVHAMQRERGFSNLYLGQPQPRLLATLDQISDETCLCEQAVRGYLDQMDIEGADRARLCHRLAYMLHSLDDLPPLRRKVRDVNVTVVDSTENFSRLIASLLAVVFEAADTAIDPQITRALVAMFNFMQCKELSGQERACGAVGFSNGYFDPARHEQMEHLRCSQLRCSEVFSQYADAAAQDRWEQIEADAGQLQQLRQMARRTSAEQTVDPGLAELWFDLCSQRIDAMHSVEGLLADGLRQLCQERLDRAAKELDNHRTLLSRLATRAADPQPLLFSVQGRSLDQASAEDPLQHSLLELLQKQSRHMHRLSDELKSARSALAERKTIEQAKRLLMSRFQLDEPAAHKHMQQAAMNNGVRLIDMAERFLAQAQE
jgi:hypothetical protein